MRICVFFSFLVELDSVVVKTSLIEQETS